jgi:hypothetical protein
MRSGRFGFPLSTLKYQPVRFAYARPFLPSFLRAYRDRLGTDAVPSMAAFSHLADLYGSIYNDLLDPLPVERRPLNATETFSNEFSAAMHYCAFVRHGRNIFHLFPTVTALFRHTDVDAIPLAALKMPYPVLYLWFGPQTDLDPWGEGDLVDGAYVTCWKTAWEIILSTVRIDRDYRQPRHVLLHPDRYYYCPLEASSADTTVGEAVTQQLLKETGFRREDLPDTGGVYDIDGRTVRLTDLRGEAQEQGVRQFAKGYPVFREALKLVLNGLCFLTAYPDDIEDRRPEETPRELVEQAQAARHGGRWCGSNLTRAPQRCTVTPCPANPASMPRTPCTT